MRGLALLLMMIVGSVLAFAVLGFGRPPSLYAQFPVTQSEGNSGPGGLIALSSDVSDGRQQITIIDPASRVMSVYHIEHSNGTITLKSVRNIRSDLLMDEYNTNSPLPREIRAILKQR
ncbi:MAG: hypothetical protein ACC628_25760 [Pirellulaceae bacterium]